MTSPSETQHIMLSRRRSVWTTTTAAAAAATTTTTTTATTTSSSSSSSHCCLPLLLHYMTPINSTLLYLKTFYGFGDFRFRPHLYFGFRFFVFGLKCSNFRRKSVFQQRSKLRTRSNLRLTVAFIVKTASKLGFLIITINVSAVGECRRMSCFRPRMLNRRTFAVYWSRGSNDNRASAVTAAEMQSDLD